MFFWAKATLAPRDSQKGHVPDRNQAGCVRPVVHGRSVIRIPDGLCFFVWLHIADSGSRLVMPAC